MKTIIFLILSILSISLVEKAQACSQSVNQLFDKNLLVAYAAGEMNVDLAKATSIAINDYSYEFTGNEPETNCSTSLISQARISVSYKPNSFTNCSFSVTVRKTEQAGITPDLTRPLLDIVTELPVSGCTRIPIILKPIPRPLPHL
jgi:hypothetical protein